MTEDVTPRRLRADAARNRQALIDAAERLFVRAGLSVTLDDIAAEAGVNVATAYRHFANKHELARAFLQQKLDAVGAFAQEAADAGDPWQGITDFLERTLELMVADRVVHDVFTQGYADQLLDRFDERITPVVERLLERGRAAGVVREEIDAGDLGVIIQMLATASDIPSDDPNGLLLRYLELILAGLRPGATRLPGRAPTTAPAREGAKRSVGRSLR